MESFAAAAPFWGVVPLYALAFVLFAWSFFLDRRKVNFWARGFLLVAAVLQVVFLTIFGLLRGEFPPVNGGETLVVLADAIALVYLYLVLKTGARGLGFFATALILAFQVGGSIRGPAYEVPEILRGIGFGAHVAFNIVAFASFTVAAFTALTYLLQYRQLRSLSPGPMLQRLPSLEQLDHMSHRSTLIGWIFLSVGLVLGARLADQVWGSPWQWDPKQCTTLLTWILFGAALWVRRYRAWQGGRMATLTLLGFFSIILAFFLFHGLLPSVHHFT